MEDKDKIIKLLEEKIERLERDLMESKRIPYIPTIPYTPNYEPYREPYTPHWYPEYKPYVGTSTSGGTIITKEKCYGS